ncbi:MAG: hypothetical protein KDC12_06180 [Flavobacteriales bacterium]|nr:hypothetical protein [Flavobacteriales bacterium]
MKRIIIMVVTVALAHLANAQIIDQFEYFWDSDPGVGLATAVSIPPGSTLDANIPISTAGLSEGTHQLGTRVKLQGGSWGITRTNLVYVRHINQAEYFWDADPGVGNGTPVTLNTTDLNIDTDLAVSSAGISGGKHQLGIRIKGADGAWSPVRWTTVHVQGEFYEGEYFWDTDPGVGNGVAFTLSSEFQFMDQSISVDNTGLTSGLHKLYMRVRTKNGSFGTTYERSIYIARTIVGGEYFWDTDPGVGNGEPLNTLNAGTTAQTCDVVSTVGIAPGEHYLYVRTVSDDNVWSVPSRIQMTVTPNDIVVGCPGDYNRDGTIDTSDLLIFLGGFGSSGECTVDLNGDFVVDTSDLLMFLSAFGSICE